MNGCGMYEKRYYYTYTAIDIVSTQQKEETRKRTCTGLTGQWVMVGWAGSVFGHVTIT